MTGCDSGREALAAGRWTVAIRVGLAPGSVALLHAPATTGTDR